MNKFLLAATLFLSSFAWGQNTFVALVHSTGVPVGPCSNGFFNQDDNTGNLYTCPAGSWVLVGGSSAVQSVSGTTNQIVSSGGQNPVISIANPVTFPGNAFLNNANVLGWTDTGISRDVAGTFDFGNGTQGNKTAPVNAQSFTANGTAAGRVDLGCTTDPGIGVGVSWVGPASCTPYENVMPSTAATGFFFATASGNRVAYSFLAAIDLSGSLVTNQLGGANGGTGINTTGLTGTPKVTNGVWTIASAPAAAWDSLTAPVSNLLLVMGANLSEWDYAANTASVFKWANTTAATSGTSQSSPTNTQCGTYWTGSASAADCWSYGVTVANGTNGQSTYNFTHSGSTGANGVVVPNGTTTLGGIGFANGNGWSSLNATILGYTNGTNYKMKVATGALTLASASAFAMSSAASVSTAADNDTCWHRGTAGTWVADSDSGCSNGGGSVQAAIFGVTGGNTFGSIENFTAPACETGFGITTLSTSGTTTDTSSNCLNPNSIIDAVVYRITTTITTAASFTIGDATTAARFCSTQSTLTAGTTGICFVQADQTGAAGPRQVSVAKVRVTTNATPGAGAIRLIVYSHTWQAPTS